MSQKHYFLAILLIAAVPALVEAQDLKLKCPFEHGMGREPKEAYTWDPPDKKLIMISIQDTIIQSMIDATVLTVMPSDEYGYQIVLHKGDYYLWYIGVKKPLVNKGQKVKTGQPLAAYEIGREVEFRLFADEDAIDPRPMIDCKPPGQ